MLQQSKGHSCNIWIPVRATLDAFLCVLLKSDNKSVSLQTSVYKIIVCHLLKGSHVNSPVSTFTDENVRCQDLLANILFIV